MALIRARISFGVSLVKSSAEVGMGFERTSACSRVSEGGGCGKELSKSICKPRGP